MIGTIDNLLTVKEFRALIDHEKSRSDREGSFFLILVLEASLKKQENLKKIIGKISCSISSSDCTGWYEKGKIAILLPEINEEKAGILRNQLTGKLNTVKDCPPLKVLSSHDLCLNRNRENRGNLKKLLQYSDRKNSLWRITRRFSRKRPVKNKNSALSGGDKKGV